MFLLSFRCIELLQLLVIRVTVMMGEDLPMHGFVLFAPEWSGRYPLWCVFARVGG